MKQTKVFKNTGISQEAFNWLQAERQRTGLRIYTIIDAALVHLAALNKGKKNGTTKVTTESLK